MTVVMAAVTALLCLLVVGVASIGGLLAARSQATVAADAAALAAVVATHPDTGRRSPPVEAARAARENGASVVRCTCPVERSLETREATVVVMIEVDAPIFGRLRVQASARAEFDPRAWLGR